MRKAASLLATIVLLLTTGCTDRPAASPRMPGPVLFQSWVQQDQANSVQDWHRMAQKIADEMQSRGLLMMSEARPDSAPAAQPRFFVRPTQETPFVHELSRALKTELLRRQASLATSPNGALVVDIAANVIVWESRVRSEPDHVRSEGIWYASLSSGNQILMTVQEPFFISTSDLAQYVHVPEPVAPTRLARRLQYAP